MSDFEVGVIAALVKRAENAERKEREWADEWRKACKRALEAERERDELKKFAEFCDYHHRGCEGLLGQHLDCDCGYSEARDKLRAALHPAEPKGE